MAVTYGATGITFGDATTQTTAPVPEFASGTLAVFQQTAAPTGWTKQLTHNNKAFRCVTGTCSSGGSAAFTTAFQSQTPSGTVSVTSVSGSAGSTTLSNPQIPSHSHSLDTVVGDNGAPTYKLYLRPINPQAPSPITATGGQGGGGSHAHPFSFSSGSGSFSGSAINLAVQYVDLIIAQKD